MSLGPGLRLTRPHVVVGIPSMSIWHADFAMDLLQMVIVSMATPNALGEPKVDVSIDNHKGSILPLQRTQLVKNSIGKGATHILFVDTDMRFPAETLVRLLDHGKDIVACNCVTKRIPAVPTARLDNGTWEGEVLQPPEQWTADMDELVEVWRVGTGVMLIRLDVFRKIEEPWFPIEFSEEHQLYRGEDWSFCQKAHDAGFKLYVDVPLSYSIQHQGMFNYSMEYVDLG